MSSPTQTAYLQHARDALLSILEYTRAGQQHFLTSKLTQDAVIRNLEIVGEAVKGLAEITRSQAPDVPWRRIAGMRDFLIHHYFGVDLHVVWQVVANDVPPLLATIERLLRESANE